MIGKIISAAVGGKLAQQTKGMDGTTGAIIGAAAPFILRRLSIPGMIALGVGGYVAKKIFDGRTEQDGQPEPTNEKTAPIATVPTPATA